MDFSDDTFKSKISGLCVNPKEYFFDLIKQGLQKRKVITFPLVESYLASLLEHYIVADKLFDQCDASGKRQRPTLAELFLKASNTDTEIKRLELLKKLGDISLYISGFFGDSLQRKVVDIDYYADMGVTAYASLATSTREEVYAKVYTEFSQRFMTFVDVLTYVSQESLGANPDNLLRLYERYMNTGSSLAKEQLLNHGLLALPTESSKNKPQ